MQNEMVMLAISSMRVPKGPTESNQSRGIPTCTIGRNVQHFQFVVESGGPNQK